MLRLIAYPSTGDTSAKVLACRLARLQASEECRSWSYSDVEGPRIASGLSSGKAQSRSTSDSDDCESCRRCSDYRTGVSISTAATPDRQASTAARFRGGSLRLIWCHCQKPSEEMIDGRQFAMLGHLVHREAKRQARGQLQCR